METVPYWRLSAFYLFYFGSLGALIPYWGLYLQSQGFSAQDIGKLMAVILITKLIAPNLWGWIAARTGRHLDLVRLSSLLAVICFSGVFISHHPLWLAFVMGSFSFFWNAALPQIEAMTFAHLGEHFHRYSHIRLWGSIGFVVTVMVLGWLFERFDITLLPILLIVLFSSIWLTSLLVPEHDNDYPAVSHEAIHQIIRRPAVFTLLFVCFLMQLSHGPYYTFYSIYLEEHDYSRSVIGQLWALGVIAEVGAFLMMHHWLERFTLHALMTASLALSGLRWLMIGYGANWFVLLIAAQLLHAASFGLFHGVSVQFIRRHFPGRLQAQGQALYSSLSFGAGGALGSFISGYTWENLGMEISYLLAAILCGIATIISWRWMREVL
ncbi:MAG: MFS transporter [Beggiatoa sp. IS2]|nr:MAG: MFS transporter [Beggiatoa sp. IS2]